MQSSLLWIPLTIAAAVGQTARNAAQRQLTSTVGTLGATLVRFLYGLPFAVLWFSLILILVSDRFGKLVLPIPSVSFVVWLLVGSVAQIAGTALLLRAMEERTFALGVAYSKTEVVQVTLFGTALLGDTVSLASAVSIGFASVGILLLSIPPEARSMAYLARSWASRSPLFGMGSGTAFAAAMVGWRGATLALEGPSIFLSAATTVLSALVLQTALLGGFLFWRNRETIVAVLRAWPVSLVAGSAGAAASAALFAAVALKPVGQVRTLGLLELVFSYIVSKRVFNERLATAELIGFALLGTGLLGVTTFR